MLIRNFDGTVFSILFDLLRLCKVQPLIFVSSRWCLATTFWRGAHASGCRGWFLRWWYVPEGCFVSGGRTKQVFFFWIRRWCHQAEWETSVLRWKLDHSACSQSSISSHGFKRSSSSSAELGSMWWFRKHIERKGGCTFHMYISLIAWEVFGE